jgi:long-subunit fatty acid transport protein
VFKKWFEITLLVCLSTTAFAGGLEFPGNGTEALGRGAAFTAKADDATAFEYNVAGFARQRGTRTLLDVNLMLSDFEFQRAGTYPDNPADPATPWGGQPFPKVRDTGGPFAAPFFGLSTDFGVLDRWTFAIGVYGPSSVGNRTYPLGIDGKPSPSRYDVVQATPLVVLPSLAVAVRAAKWLDIGLALHIPVGKFDLASVSYTDISSTTCKNPEYQPCDALNQLHTIGATATASLGALIRPVKWVAFGFNVRAPYTISSSGTVHPTAPAVLNNPSMPLTDEPASFTTSFPWIVRAGLRFVYMKGTHEAADIEFDGTWEGWGHVDDPQVNIPNLSIFTDITPKIVHNFHDTYSLRLGGAINPRLPVGVLSVRAGAFYDSSATNVQDTRLDFDTLDKIGITAGLGYKVRGFQINVAYAYLIEGSRTVTNGTLTPINGAAHGMGVDSQGNPLPAVNNGVYTASTQILSVGVTVAWDDLVKSDRVVRYHADYEEGGPMPTPARPSAPRPVEEPESPATEEQQPESSQMEISPSEVAELEAEQTPSKKKHTARKSAKKKRHKANRARLRASRD